MTLLLGTCLVALISANGTAEDSLTVSTPSGTVHGYTDGVQRIFLNLPFGTPPVGPLRWRPAQPSAPWSGIRDATQQGPYCAQNNSPLPWPAPPVVVGSEDCLYLNVYAPASSDADSRLPVMVYLSPGGGTNEQNNFDFSNLVKRGVIMVSPNYRVDVFGIFGTTLLTNEFGGLTSPNFSMYDQTEALRWVKKHIRSFGGDPDNVTLLGSSAGTNLTEAHLANPMSKGLFHKAVLASAAHLGALRLADEDLWGDVLAESLGCGADQVTNPLACLRNLDFATLTHAWNSQYNSSQGSNGFGFFPVIDGITVLDVPKDFVAAHGSVPLMVGDDSDEAISFGGSPPESIQDFIAGVTQAPFGAWYPPLTHSQLMRTLSLYPIGGQVEPEPAAPLYLNHYLAFTAYVTDAVWTCNERAIAEAIANYGQSVGDDAEGEANPVYWYYMTYQQPDLAFTGLPYPAAYHMESDDFIMGFAGSTHLLTPAEIPLSNAMADYWTNFGKRSNPNGAGLPTWPQFRLQTQSYLNLNTSITIGANLKDKECDFLTPLDRYYPMPASNLGPDPQQYQCGQNFLTNQYVPCSTAGYVGPFSGPLGF